MTFLEAPPKASVLIESMRDIGYSLDTALADVVDNSISAGATKIDILVDTVSSAPCVAILDNGRGMTHEELIEAMRLGSRSPREDRAISDLGRFGLGMKTASFSQCRRLTVISRRQNSVCAAQWDLDSVTATNTWSIRVPQILDEIPFFEQLISDGSLVVWQNLDRAVEKADTSGGRKHFVEKLDHARSHLELVFHRFLTGEHRLSKVAMSMNEVPLKPFDPFNSNHSATERGQTDRVHVGTGIVEITPFTLPHHRNVSRADWEYYGGPSGYLKSQGFYLYRERRLILHGTWFSLARQAELTKLCRVRIDIPNSMDAEWHVDVKKASATPPIVVRERLRNLIQEIGAPSKRIFTQRGFRIHGARLPIWQRAQQDNAIVYRLNQDNPAIKQFAGELTDRQRAHFDRLMRTIGAGLPMDGIFADLAATPENVKCETLADDALQELLSTHVSAFRDLGVESSKIPDLLKLHEPFRTDWVRTEAFLEKLEEMP